MNFRRGDDAEVGAVDFSRGLVDLKGQVERAANDLVGGEGAVFS